MENKIVGVISAPFQCSRIPLEHRKAIADAARHCDVVIFMLPTTEATPSKNNPLSFDIRVEMIEDYISNMLSTHFFFMEDPDVKCPTCHNKNWLDMIRVTVNEILVINSLDLAPFTRLYLDLDRNLVDLNKENVFRYNFIDDEHGENNILHVTADSIADPQEAFRAGMISVLQELHYEYSQHTSKPC